MGKNRLFDRWSIPKRIAIPESPFFGKPTLQWLKNNGTESNGRAEWTREWRRYGQWTAKLSPGIQTDDDYGAISFTVDDMPLTSLETIKYIYRMGATEVVAPNVAIHVYDPDDHDSRADISFSHSYTDLPKSSGWRNFNVTTALDGFFYFGNNLSDSGTTGLTQCDGTSATNYTLAEFQADAVFGTYVISKITIEYGYYNTGLLSPAHICKIEVNGENIPLEPSVEEQLAITRDELAEAQRTIPTWTFGRPTLRQSNRAQASWSRWQWQQSNNGWCANLYGGIQTGYDNVARVEIPVNEMPIGDLETLIYSWNATETELNGPAIQIHLHDPADNDHSVNVTQAGSKVELTGGWCGHELDLTTDQFFWYGEDGNGGSGLSEGIAYQYGIDDYQSDALFGTWTIHRIDIYWGAQGGGEEYKSLYVGEIKINGTAITLGPESGRSSIDALATKTIVGGAATALDVVSENASTGEDWDFNVGASGYITKAIVTIATTTLTERLALFLFTVAPTGEVNDNVANDSPVALDIPYFVGVIDFPAMVDRAAGGPSYTIATPSTVGNLPLAYKGPVLYGILVGLDGGTLGNVLCSIHLFADINEDN